MLDVPRPLVQHLGRPLATCLVPQGRGHNPAGRRVRISRPTAYRYRDEGIAVLAAQASDLHTALHRAAKDGWSHVILDGKLFDCDRLTETTLSVRGETIDAWYPGKHRDFGANVQAVMRPDGLPIWTSDAVPGHLLDISCARELGVTAALNWSAAELDLPALADSSYESAGHGIKTPIKQSSDGSRLAPDKPRLQPTTARSALAGRTRLRHPDRTLEDADGIPIRGR